MSTPPIPARAHKGTTQTPVNPRAEGTTRQRGTLRRSVNAWHLVYREPRDASGRRRQRSVRLGSTAEIRTKAEARRAADRFLSTVGAGRFHAGQAMPWPQWCAIYEDRHLVLLARGSQIGRRSIIHRHLVDAPEFAGLCVHEITPARIQACIIRMLAEGAAPSTIRARFALLRRILRAASEAGLAAEPPRADRFDFPRDEAAPRSIAGKAFSEGEVAAILERGQEPLRTACACMRFLGLRVGEALGLTWDAIDLQTGTVEVRQQAQDGRLRALKTRSSRAMLRAPAPLLAHLVSYRAHWQPNAAGLLFAEEDRGPLDATRLRDSLHALLEELGIRRRGFHAFRHACALAMAQAGRSPESIRRAMRHSSLRNTAVYLSASPEDVAAALDAGAQRVAQVLHAETRSPQKTQAFGEIGDYPQANHFQGAT